MIQQNRYEHELYESRRKAQLDENTRRLEYERGLAKSLADGIAQGMAQGEVRGEMKGQIKVLERFLKLTASSATQLDAMSFDELEQRVNELQSAWAAQSKPS